MPLAYTVQRKNAYRITFHCQALSYLEVRSALNYKINLQGRLKPQAMPFTRHVQRYIRKLSNEHVRRHKAIVEFVQNKFELNLLTYLNQSLTQRLLKKTMTHKRPKHDVGVPAE